MRCHRERAFARIELPAVRKRERRAFTLIELLVVVAVISILAAMTMPALLRSMRQASLVKCQSNLRQIGAANSFYADQWSQYYPIYGTYYEWERALAPPEMILPYADDPGIHVCPIDPTPHNHNWWTLKHPTLTKSSYMWNEHVMTYSLYDPPGDGAPGWQHWSGPRTSFWKPVTIGLVADGGMCPNGWRWDTCLLWEQSPPYSSRIDWQHDGSVNVLFGDLRVEKVHHTHIFDVRSYLYK